MFDFIRNLICCCFSNAEEAQPLAVQNNKHINYDASRQILHEKLEQVLTSVLGAPEESEFYEVNLTGHSNS